MKLSDIDILTTKRAQFLAVQKQLKDLRTSNFERVVFNSERQNSGYVTNPAAIRKLRELAIAEVEIEFNEAKATMMALGVTEFPE